jgi:hypothetical protein
MKESRLLGSDTTLLTHSVSGTQPPLMSNTI